MSTTQQPAVERTISGTLTGVEMRTAGWHRFSILEPGNQYPYRADTKKKDLIDQAMSLMNQDVVVQVVERQSNVINEHSGEFFVNKYLNAIAAQSGATVQSRPETAQQGAVQRPEQHGTNVVQPGVSGYDKDLTIWRQTAAKVIAASWQVLPEEQRNPKGMVEACEAWVAYFVYGPARFGVQAFSGGGMTGKEAVAIVAEAQALHDRGGGVYTTAPPEQTEEEFIRSLGEGEKCELCGFAAPIHSLGCPNGDAS